MADAGYSVRYPCRRPIFIRDDCFSLELFSDADAGRVELQRLQQPSAFGQWQSCEIAAFENEEVEDEIVNPGCAAAEL